MPFHLDPLLAIPIWQRLRRMGGPGLVLLGIADNSVIPLTGSMDVLTIANRGPTTHSWRPSAP
jgi:hypothetical protein